MTAPSSLRSVAVPASCANCVHLDWSDEQGWDKCGKHGQLINWPMKSKQVCDDHDRSSMADPRVQKAPPKGHVVKTTFRGHS